MNEKEELKNESRKMCYRVEYVDFSESIILLL